MKKLLLTLLLPLITFSSLSYGDELNSLFGITLYDNAEKHVSSNYIDSNKYKNLETIEGYFDLTITDKIKTKSPYASSYKVTMDINNIVYGVYGEKEYSNMTNCQTVLESLLSSLEKRYEIDFEYGENSFPTFKIFSYYYYTSSDDYFAIQCNEDFEDYSIVMQIFIDTEVLGDAIDEFYDSGL